MKDQLATLMKGNLPADVAAQAKTLDASLTKIGGVMTAARRWLAVRSPRSSRSQGAAIVLQTEQRLQHHGQHDAGRPRHGAHPHPDRHLAERLHRPNRTMAAWKAMQKQIADFNAVLVKNNYSNSTSRQPSSPTRHAASSPARTKLHRDAVNSLAS